MHRYAAAVNTFAGIDSDLTPKVECETCAWAWNGPDLAHDCRKAVGNV